MTPKSDFKLYDYFCMRLPALPLESIFTLTDYINKQDLSQHEVVVNIIENLFNEQYFRKALFVSSNELYFRIKEFQKRNYPDVEESKKLLIALYKFYSRMSTRSTPYGLFAGVTNGELNNEPSKFKFNLQKYRPRFQFSINFITDIIRKINPVSEELRNSIKYYPNNTIYFLSNRVFYVEKIEKNGYLASNLTSISNNVFVSKILSAAREGKTFNALLELIDLESASESQKINFVANLIKSQVLISELWPCISSNDYLATMMKKSANVIDLVPKFGDIRELYEVFTNTQTLDDIDQVEDFLNKPNHKDFAQNKDLFKVDLFINMETNQIKKSVFEKINEAAFELMKVTVPKTSDTMEAFKRAFQSKYEEKEIPLSLALDPNFGIGYAMVVNGSAEYTPLISGIPINFEVPPVMPNDTRLAIIRKNVLKKYLENNSLVVDIESMMHNWMSEQNPNFYNKRKTSTYLFGSLYAKNAQELDEGNYKFYAVQLLSPYAGRLVSRFLYGNEKLFEKTLEVIRDEQKNNPDVILAEVVYIPDGKYANISLCPNIRNYEIPYTSTSSAGQDFQISIDDLYISLRNNRIILRSKKLNKEIIPCATNTYDATFGNPIFQFLSGLSYQNTSHGFFWDWGPVYYSEPFLPRVEYKNIILSKARWFAKKTNLNLKNSEAIKKHFDFLREEIKLPKYVLLQDGDNELMIDLDNEICRFILAKELNKGDQFLFEVLNLPENCFVVENNLHYSNEILVPLKCEGPMHIDHYSDISNVNNEHIKRCFHPGSEWQYLKIYSGSKNLEFLLTEVIGPYADKLYEENIIDKWFFIKYNDPEYHLRVRFLKSNKSENPEWYKITETINKLLNESFSEMESVKLSLDTYVREIERYGALTIEDCEAIFHADSIASYKFLSLLNGNEGEELRWQFAFISIDYLLEDFNFSIENKFNLLSQLANNFFNEFAPTTDEGKKNLMVSLNENFRQKKALIRGVLEKENAFIEFEEAYKIFTERSKLIRNLSGNIIENHENLFGLLASIIHMSMNRLFLINQRRHELVIYYLLNKYFESKIAQLEINGNEIATTYFQ